MSISDIKDSDVKVKKWKTRLSQSQ
jgi:hypothetical protein